MENLSKLSKEVSEKLPGRASRKVKLSAAFLGLWSSLPPRRKPYSGPRAVPSALPSLSTTGLWGLHTARPYASSCPHHWLITRSIQDHVPGTLRKAERVRQDPSNSDELAGETYLCVSKFNTFGGFLCSCDIQNITYDFVCSSQLTHGQMHTGCQEAKWFATCHRAGT